MTTIFTRSDYLNAHEDRAAAHRRYYGQFVNSRTIKFVVSRIGADRLLASTDEHLNDIPLACWDMMARTLPLARPLEDAGDYLTLGNAVCIAKEAARQWLDAQASKPTARADIDQASED